MKFNLEKLGECKSLEEVADWKEGCEKEFRETDFHIEKIADICHRQWAHWTIYLAKNGYLQNKPKMREWLKQARTPYLELCDKDKNKDRFFAKAYAQLIREEILG